MANSRSCAVSVAVAFVIVIAIVLVAMQGAPEPINSFEDCVRAGNPVMESYPPQCRTSDGRTFVGPLSP